MAQASSSRMTLDAVGVLLAASLARDYPGKGQHQPDTLPLNSMTPDDADAEADYDSDGFCTPPLPSQEQLSQAATYFSPRSQTSYDNQQRMPSSVIKPSIPPSSAHTINGVVVALPSRSEVPDADGFLETVVVKLEIDETAPVMAPKRKRGRPLGSTKARKLERQQEIEQLERARASSFRETLRDGDNQASSAVASKSPPRVAQESTTDMHITIETSGPTAQLQLDQLEQAFERGKEMRGDKPIDAIVEEEVQGEVQPIDAVPEEGGHAEEIWREEVQAEETQEIEAQDKDARAGDEMQAEEAQEDEVREEASQEAARSPTPEQALLPDFIFEPPDESMFAELRAFLDQEDANTTVSSNGDPYNEDDIDLEIYEQRRLKKLRANEAILSKLGLGQQPLRSPMPALDVEEREESEPIASPVRTQGRKPYKPPTRSIRLDPDGTTTSLPLPGCTFEVAYVDMPVLRPRIRLQHKFHDNIPVLPPRTEPLSDEEWEDEPLPPPSPVKKVTKSVKKGPPVGPRRGLTGEALEGKGTTCHQCRVKTEEPKMRCRHHEEGRVCPLFYCERCLKIRYDIDFDEDSRTFECPRCLAYCNCSLCIHRAGLSKICGGALGAKLLDGEGNRLYPSVKHYLDAKVGRPVKIGRGGLLGKPKPTTSTTMTIDTDEGEEEPSSTQKGEKQEKRRRGKEGALEKREKTDKSERKRKAADEAAPGEPKKRKVKAKKQQQTAEEVGNGEEEMLTSTRTPLEALEEDTQTTSRSRKIKLTFKAKATAEEEELRRQRLKHDRAVRSVNAPRGRKVQFAKPAVTAVRRGRPPAAKKIVPQIIEAANVWVKSKADVAPSSSDSELEESTWRTMSEDSDLTSSDEDDEEEMGAESGLSNGHEHRLYDSEMDDGAGQDYPGDEDSSSMQGTADSPQAGQVEFTHHPELTMTEYPMNASHSVFQSSGLIPFVEDTHAFVPPTAPELTDFLQQLMGAGVI